MGVIAIANTLQSSGDNDRLLEDLTAKQRCFVEEYLIDLNATAAARRAGYSARSKSQGWRLMKRPAVAAAIAAAMRARAKRTRISADTVLTELASIAFADMGDYMVLGEDGALRFDFSALPEGATKAMAEVTQEEFNARHAGETRPVRRTRFKLHSKLTALERLGQHLGLFKPALDADDAAPRGETGEGPVLSDLERAHRIIALLERAKAAAREEGTDGHAPSDREAVEAAAASLTAMESEGQG